MRLIFFVLALPLLLVGCDYQPRPGATAASPSASPAAAVPGGECAVTLAIQGMT